MGWRSAGSGCRRSTCPTALNTGDNSGPSFCVLFGAHEPFDEATLDELYPTHARYVAAVVRTDNANFRAGYLDHADAIANRVEAAHADVGR